MRNSVILGMILKIYEKAVLYYKASESNRVLQRMGKSFREYAASSSILNFFAKEWNIGSVWKRSFVFRVLISPLKLFKYTSNKLADGTNTTLEGSKALNCIRALFEDLFNLNTRIYGLLTFAVTQELLGFALNHGELSMDINGIIRLVLFLVGTMLILINRPVKYLVEGSIVGRIAYDFFIVRGLKDGTDDKV
jgi:hypothetical protein